MNTTAKTILIMCNAEQIRDFYWRAYFAALEGLASDPGMSADVAAADTQADLLARVALARAGVVLQ